MVYIGIKESNMKTVYAEIGGRGRDYGMMLLNDNYQTSLMEEQKEACLALLYTNGLFVVIVLK